MKTILKIGGAYFLIPASVNVNAILAALQKAEPVEYDYVGSKKIFRLQRRHEHSHEIEVSLVDDNAVIKPPPRKALPETASPDAHNTF